VTFLAGQVPTADEFNDLFWLVAYKASDTSRASTTTVAVDPDLTIALDADALYEWVAVIRASGNGGDIKTSWDVPSGASSVQRTAHGPELGTADATNTNVRMTSGHASSTEVPYGLTTANCLIVERGLLQTDSAGDFTLEWAQDSSNINATTVETGSYLKALKIG
jgi:hypothetical protein